MSLRNGNQSTRKPFNGMKGALAAQPSLAYPDHTKRYTVTCDWQPGHMAAILSQPHSVEVQEEALGTVQEVERPVHFIARKLSGYEAGWQATTGEQACVVWAVRKFHCYLYGVEFTLITDHKALVSMLHCQDTTGKLARWNVDLYPYDFRVQYRPGSQLCNADGLSRTDKEIRAEAPDPALISTVAPVFTEASDSRGDEGWMNASDGLTDMSRSLPHLPWRLTLGRISYWTSVLMKTCKAPSVFYLLYDGNRSWLQTCCEL